MKKSKKIIWLLVLSVMLSAVQVPVQAESWSKSISKTITNKKDKISNVRYVFEVKKDCEVTIEANGKDEDMCPGAFGLIKGERNLKYDYFGKWINTKSQKTIEYKGRKQVYKLKKGSYTLVHECWSTGKKVTFKVSSKDSNVKFKKLYNSFDEMPDDAWD